MHRWNDPAAWAPTPEDALSAANHVRAATGVATAGLPSVALHVG